MNKVTAGARWLTPSEIHEARRDALTGEAAWRTLKFLVHETVIVMQIHRFLCNFRSTTPYTLRFCIQYQGYTNVNSWGSCGIACNNTFSWLCFYLNLCVDGQSWRHCKTRTLDTLKLFGKSYPYRLLLLDSTQDQVVGCCNPLKNYILKLSVLLKPITCDSMTYSQFSLSVVATN
jgi:hypothetical protein